MTPPCGTTPKLKKRTALVRALKEVFRRHRSQPIERVIGLINPVLRGWVNYFAVGHSSECFSFIKLAASRSARSSETLSEILHEFSSSDGWDAVAHFDKGKLGDAIRQLRAVAPC